MMERKKFISLTIFDADPAPEGGDKGGQQETKPTASGSYSYAQAEEIATARAQKAERAALASYFKQQGLDEDQVTEAIKAYKAAQKAKEPDVETLTRERDEALAKAAAYEQAGTLSAKGVKPEFAEFVAFKARELMQKDEKLDTFEKAADKFLKDNPAYSGKQTSYRVKQAGEETGTGKDKAGDKTAAKAELNALLKAAARRGK